MEVARSITLDSKKVVRLHPKAPFHFDASLHKPDHFPSGNNHWEPGVRWQTMLWQNEPLGLRFLDRGTIEEPVIELSVWSRGKLDSSFFSGLTQEIDYRYNTQVDLTEFTGRFERDPQLGPVISKWRGMRPLNYSSLYEYLMISIVLQNASVRRSVSMLQTLLEHYGTLLSFGGKQLYSFWQAKALQRVTEEELRSLKLGYRAKSIKRVTEAFVIDGMDEFRLRSRPREEQRETLLGLYGIGPASVGYLLFDVFHHLDELNYISPWEQRIYSKLFLGVSPDEPVPTDRLLELFRRRFGEYRMLAVHYIWEDLFWQRKNRQVEWLEKLIRL